VNHLHGFRILKDQEIKELKCLARLFRHEKTGAELLSLSNDDENKVFGITFRTPPQDSTGVAHILEHSVLCGSRKYPVKEPFVELLKGSLQTFLNAMTYPDKTCYPVASQNLKDFYNLIDVYLDAVFYPRLTPFVFQQEGWHFELEDPENPLIYKGVVFSEMKGAYSSPDNVLSEYSTQSLFPDNAYGFDSGGDPRIIPELTFEKFKAFHERYYHPSNARIFFYGDDDTDQRLRFLNDYLRAFDPLEINSGIQLQPPFKEPVRMVRPFMTGKGEDKEAKGMVTMNWLLAETIQIETNFALHILTYILLGMPASPLRKALIESGLGEDISGEGLGSELRQMYLSTGLKGIQVKNAGRVEALIVDTLEGLVKQGIDSLTIEAAINTIEFNLRENNTGRFPRGLSLMLRSLTTWLYGGDPFSLLAFEEPLESIKSRIRKNESYFEDLIEDLLLTNTHRTTLILEPDPDLKEKEDSVERERLSKARTAMDKGEVIEIIKNTRQLKRLQEMPDTPEALATIPVLSLKDLDKENKTLPISLINEQGPTILFHEMFTNGIAYFDLGFNLHTLPGPLLPYVPLFGRALVEMGTEKEDFISLTQRISRKTGGIHPQTFTSTVREQTHCAAWLFLRAKAIMTRVEEMMAILKDVLLTVRLDNRERFRQMLLEEKARMEQRLIPSGHQMVNLRLRSLFGEAHWAAEQMGGISYLFFLRKLSQMVDKDWSRVLSVLTDIRKRLVNRASMIANVTLDKSNRSRFRIQLNHLMEAIPHEPTSIRPWKPGSSASFEGMTLPSQVNYVGKGANIYQMGYRFHGSIMAITRYLRNAWLWDRVRVLGGAYGAFCMFDRLSGILTFVSYRDPNLIKTLETFDTSHRFLKKLDLSDRELTKAIIGAIGDMDAHMLPDAKGYTSMLRYLNGISESDRQQMRDEILGTRISDFGAFAHILEKVKEEGVIKVLGSSNAIQEAFQDKQGGLNITKVL
jgi:Zn-dependent M16 (insulinase) family peptidase